MNLPPPIFTSSPPAPNWTTISARPSCSSSTSEWQCSSVDGYDREDKWQLITGNGDGDDVREGKKWPTRAEMMRKSAKPTTEKVRSEDEENKDGVRRGGGDVRQILAGNWLCRRCSRTERTGTDKRKKKSNKRVAEKQNQPEELFYGNWRSLSQIVHLRAWKRSSLLTESNSSSMEENEDEKKAGCGEAFCGKKMKEWAFWFIVTFLAGLTIKDLINLVKEYSENPKKSDMNVRFNETMQLPNITFCMSRAQAWSHFRLNGTEKGSEWDNAIATQLKNMTDKEAFLKNPWEFGMVMETYNLISTLTSMERETSAHGTVNSIDKFRTLEKLADIRKLSKFWLAELETRGVSFEEFVQKVGKETLRRSMQRFQRTTYDEDEVIRTQLTITWLSQWQLCFQPTFDEENLKPISDQGQFFVMSLSHNAEKLDGQQVDCMSADFHGRPSSSSRFMGNKGTTKDGFTDELCIGMMHETTVDVKARYKMLPNDEEGTACRDDGDDSEDNEWDCHLRCRLNFIRDLCNCTGPTLSYLVKSPEEEMQKWPLCDYAECKVDVQGGNYSDEECSKKCFRSCDQIRYNIDHEKKGKSARPDFTTVVLNWGSFEYLTLEQDWVWSVTTFISAIGGSIGMWLGLSILSLIQGSTYLADYVTHNVIKKRKQRQLSIADEDMQQQQPKISKASRVHPKLSKLGGSTTDEHDDKLAANPFASPFKKLSQVLPPPAEG